MLFGRDDDLRALSAMLDGLRAGHGGSLVLRGTVGIGKSALLAGAADAAASRGITVLRAGDGGGALTPLLARLPARQRRIGTSRSARYRLAVALVEALANEPTLVVADDAEHWDEATWEVLGCVGRRLGGHPVALLVALSDAAVHDRRLAASGLPERVLAPLPPVAARVLLDHTVPGLPELARDRVLTMAAGNPLALIEFGHAAAGEALVPSVLVPSVSQETQRRFAVLIDALPPATQVVLLAAAFGDGPALGQVLAAAASVDGRPYGPADVEPAVTAGLLDVDDQFRMRPRHPLLRWILWQRTDPALRSRMHAAVDGSDGAYDPCPVGNCAPRADMDSLVALALRITAAPPDAAARERFVAVVESVCRPPGDPRLLACLGLADPIGRGAAVLEGIRRASVGVDHSPYEQFLLGCVADVLGAWDLAARFIADSLPGMRADGRQADRALVLALQAWTAAQRGDVGLGLSAAMQARALAAGRAELVAVIDAIRAQVEGLRGNGGLARELADTAEREDGAGTLPVAAMAAVARGVAALGEGRGGHAARHLHRLFDPADRAHHPLLGRSVVALMAEAGYLCGRWGEVRRLIAEVEPFAARTGSPALLRALAYARAVTARDEEADTTYRQALTADLAAWPFERARLELAYGSWLRRQRRPGDAREWLRSAATALEALGVDAWAERARRELRSLGGPRPEPAGRTLTAQQQRIAGLAAEGLSNRAIAERLFLSPRTVSTHLSRIYAKVSASSRADLARVLSHL